MNQKIKKIKIKNKKKYNNIKKIIKKLKKNIMNKNEHQTDINKKLFQKINSLLDKCAKKNIIHKNKSARYKKKLNIYLKKNNIKF